MVKGMKKNKKISFLKASFLNFIYNFPRVLLINSYKLFTRIRVIDPKKIPKEKSAIFAFNHTTGADPIIALGALKKKLYFIADSDRFRTRFTNFFFRKFTNSIPVFKKEFLKNTGSFKELISLSMQNKIFFGIFPEGTLVKKGLFGKFHSGAAYLSYKTKIPIIPVYIHNIHRGPKPGSRCDKNPILEGTCSLLLNTFRRINVFIGAPIEPVAENILADIKELADKKSYKTIIENITLKLEEEFRELKKEAENSGCTSQIKTAKNLSVLKGADSSHHSCPSHGGDSLLDDLFDEDLSEDDLAQNAGNLS